jgi:integrase
MRPRSHPIFTEYLKLLEAAERTQLTMIANRQAFNWFETWLKEKRKNADTLTAQDLRAYQADLLTRYAVATVRRNVTCLRSAYTMAHESGGIASNPTRGITKFFPRPPERLPETLTADELRRLHAATRDGDRVRVAFMIFMFSGIRRHELLALKWKREHEDDSFVDFDTEQLVIHGKQGKVRFVPLHPVLLDFLNSEFRSCGWDNKYLLRCREKPMHNRVINEVMRDLFDRAGVRAHSPCHIFRRTLTTSLIRNRVLPHIVDQILGWAPSTIRQRHYTGRSTEDARTAIRLAYVDEPPIPELRAFLAPQVEASKDAELLALKLQLLEAQKQLLEQQVRALSSAAA